VNEKDNLNLLKESFTSLDINGTQNKISIISALSQKYIGFILIVTFCLILFLIILIIFIRPDLWITYKEFLNIIYTPLLTIVSTIIGYYFGKSK
jgi:TRAP-type C4-dicarboxylate transport system permease small subunit